MSMVLPEFIMTIPRKKAVFESILSDELKDCKHRINVRYEWNRSDKMLEVGVSDKNTIELCVNLITGSQKYFGNFIKGKELELRYIAYFISAYVRCLDEADISTPQSYFSGLVLLCAINCLCRGKNVKVFSPIERKPRELRPIDVYCAISALTRLTIDHGDKLSEGLKDGFNSTIGELLTYSMLPEIGYRNGTPTYSLLQEIRELHENIMSHKCDLTNYALFDECGLCLLKDLSLNDFSAMCEKSHNLFGGNVAIRLSVHLGEHIDIVNGQESFITNCIQRFQENAVKYYLDIKKTENLLLLDNFMAIKSLSQKSEYTFSKVAKNSGRIHCFR